MNLSDKINALRKAIAELTKLVMNMRAGGGGGGGAHAILSATHSDTTIAAVQRGDIITGQGVAPKWTRKGKGLVGRLLGYDANDVVDVDPATLDVDKVDGLHAAQIDADKVDGQHAAAFAAAGHHGQHENGGGDAIKLDNLAAPDNNTDLDATVAAHGLCPKGTNTLTKFLRDDLMFVAVGGGTTPLFFQGAGSRRNCILTSYGAGMEGYGGNYAAVGVSASAIDDFTSWRRVSAAVGGQYGYRSTAAYWRRAHNPTFWARIMAYSSIANQRIWVGFWSNTGNLTADDPGANHIALFRYSSAVGGNWYFCTKDGAVINAIDTGLAAAVDTIYDVRIDLEDGGDVHWAITPFGGATVSGNTNVNLPGNSIDLLHGVYGHSIVGTTYFYLAYFYQECD